MSRRYLIILLSLFLLPYAIPVYAQGGGAGDGGAVMLVADTSSQENPAAPGTATEGHMGHGGHSMPMMSHGGSEGRHAFWARLLNLSDEQKAKMKDIHRRFYSETRGLRYDIMEKRIELKRLFLDPKSDTNAIVAKEHEVSALRQKLHDALFKMAVDWRAVLTPEQLQKLDMLYLAHHEGMGGMAGRMGMMREGRGMGRTHEGKEMMPGCMGMPGETDMHESGY